MYFFLVNKYLILFETILICNLLNINEYEIFIKFITYQNIFIILIFLNMSLFIKINLLRKTKHNWIEYKINK